MPVTRSASSGPASSEGPVGDSGAAPSILFVTIDGQIRGAGFGAYIQRDVCNGGTKPMKVSSLGLLTTLILMETEG